MKCICPISGFIFPVPFFTGTISVPHPIFSQPTKRLMVELANFNTKLPEAQQVLLFLALLNKPGKIQWRSAFHATDDAVRLVQANIHNLARTVERLESIISPSFSAPEFVASNVGESNTLKGLLRAMELWNESIVAFESHQDEVAQSQKVLRAELVLERIFRMRQRKPELFAKTLADWAAVAAEFPTTSAYFAGTVQPTNEYWKELIRRCVLKKNLLFVRDDDLVDLLEYCEEEIPHGSTYAHILMQILRSSVKEVRQFKGLPLVHSVRMYRIVPMTSEEEEQNKREEELLRNMAQSAPEQEPKAHEFSNMFLYLRARARWDAMQKLKKEGVPLEAPPVEEPSEPADVAVNVSDYDSVSDEGESNAQQL